MTIDVTLSLTIPAALAASLRQEAAQRGWTPESLAVDCVAQHLEAALRHRVVLERMEQVDAALLQLAQTVGQIEAAAEAVEPGALCRYRPDRDPAGTL
ncbi:hypothetical protein G4G93_32635 [Methylobacterium sp. DB0501]|jgi:hypothetical protein|uniref:hypothetical protein n=1 Tax=Methylobacterium sp. DB0501 TaxID=2709665 RepID=UPI0013ED769D|nr:hypothetical protein [Methylobacterium sp. DB0501]MBE7198473.1 hypothetical protein [Parafilimonas terrae]NGM38588.1 hypothetical protein [Methylobacterium sp. DB0501]